MLNKIDVQGRIVHTPELRHTTSGTSVLNLDLACDRSRKDADGNRPTDFFSVNVWGKLAEVVAQHCGKGDTIIVSGRMESRKYTDKNGNNRTAWELQAESFEFCSKSQKRDNSVEVGEPEPAEDPAGVPDGDPF